MSLKDLQEKIEKSYSRQIRLEKTSRKRTESLQEFLIKFFTEWNSEKSTVYVDNKEEQTDPGRRRSLGDIFMICKYYYPNVKLEEVLCELYVGLPKHFNKGYRTSYCYTINKRVWYFDENQSNLFYDKTKNDEYGNPYRYYLALVSDEPIEDEEDPACPDCGLVECECEIYDDDYEDEQEGYAGGEGCQCEFCLG